MTAAPMPCQTSRMRCQSRYLSLRISLVECARGFDEGDNSFSPSRNGVFLRKTEVLRIFARGLIAYSRSPSLSPGLQYTLRIAPGTCTCGDRRQGSGLGKRLNWGPGLFEALKSRMMMYTMYGIVRVVPR